MKTFAGPRWLRALMLAAALGAAWNPASAQGPDLQPAEAAAAQAAEGAESPKGTDGSDSAAESEADRIGAAAEAANGGPPVPAAVRDPHRGPVTNLPLPRYVSLKGSEGNARRGPSLSHRIDWVFRHAGMPLRVTAEYGPWRRVEDRDGAGGWIHYSLLSGVRTALVAEDMTEMRARPDENASVTARAEQGAILKLGPCADNWCQIVGGGASGWVRQSQIWGVDPGEERE